MHEGSHRIRGRILRKGNCMFDCPPHSQTSPEVYSARDQERAGQRISAAGCSSVINQQGYPYAPQQAKPCRLITPMWEVPPLPHKHPIFIGVSLSVVSSFFANLAHLVKTLCRMMLSVCLPFPPTPFTLAKYTSLQHGKLRLPLGRGGSQACNGACYAQSSEP